MKVNPIPEGFHAITPYLTVPDAGRLVDFLKRAFDGIEHAKILRPDGTGLGAGDRQEHAADKHCQQLASPTEIHHQA